MEKHTPGPWKANEIDESGGYDCLTAAISITVPGGRETIAEIDLRHYGQESCRPPLPPAVVVATANAHLIAAAPDMLKCCEQAALLYESAGLMKSKEFRELCAVLIKAKGEDR